MLSFDNCSGFQVRRELVSLGVNYQRPRPTSSFRSLITSIALFSWPAATAKRSSDFCVVRR